MTFYYRFEDDSGRGWPKHRFYVGFMLNRHFAQKMKLETTVAGYGLYLRFFGKAFVLFFVTATHTRDLTNFVKEEELSQQK